MKIRSQSTLHALLLTITKNVYFQPPANMNIKYPCIVYNRDSVDTKYSNNKAYCNTIRYLVTVIDQNPNSDMIAKMLLLNLCRFDRHYTKDNLNHDVYNLYF